MEAARATWTDSRLDDLNDRVKGVDERVKTMDTKMDARFTRLDSRVDGTNERIDKLQHTIIVVGGSLFAAFVTFLTAILGLIVTLIVLHS
jgi:hypothetical protein